METAWIYRGSHNVQISSKNPDGFYIIRNCTEPVKSNKDFHFHNTQKLWITIILNKSHEGVASKF